MTLVQTHSRHLEHYLDYVRPESLAPIAQLWGILSPTSKAAAITAIREALNDPMRVQRLVASLSVQEQTALAMVKFLGGDSDAEGLTAALQILGFPPAAGGESISAGVVAMVTSGLLLHDSHYEPLTVSTRYGPCRVVADDRILAHSDTITCVPLPLTPCPHPETSVRLHAAAVTLDLLTILHAIDRLGGLKRTTTGAFRVADCRQITRALGWADKGGVLAGAPFHSAVEVLITILWAAGVLIQPRGPLIVSPDADVFVRQPYDAQVRALLQYFVTTTHWHEWTNPPWRESSSTRQIQARVPLIAALMALPPDDAFYALDDLDLALFARMGTTFSLAGTVHPPLLRYRESLPDGQSVAAWQHAQLWTQWQNREGCWIRRALRTWPMYLGLVEIGMTAGVLTAVRLTDLGRAILQPWHAVGTGGSLSQKQPAWLVQANFEVLVYLERASADLLVVLARHAERVQGEAHVARYRLTHESVYAGLERGGTLADLLATLQQGAGTDLPQNVQATLHDWARQREQITIHRRARLLAFHDAQARQKAIADGLQGTLVGERFVLVAPGAALRGKTRIDYAKPHLPCLTATEAGVLTLTKPSDCFLVAHLDQWAERTADDTWRLTAASVGAATAAKRQIGELLALLHERLTHPIPPVLEVALRAWSGERSTSTLGTALIFQCRQPTVMRAIAGSELFRPYIREVLGATAVLVDARHASAFRERLAWIGLEVSADGEIGP